jgi:hypothetical protein
MKINRSFFKTAGIWNSIINVVPPVVALLIYLIVLILRSFVG